MNDISKCIGKNWRKCRLGEPLSARFKYKYIYYYQLENLIKKKRTKRTINKYFLVYNPSDGMRVRRNFFRDCLVITPKNKRGRTASRIEETVRGHTVNLDGLRLPIINETQVAQAWSGFGNSYSTISALESVAGETENIPFD